MKLNPDSPAFPIFNESFPSKTSGLTIRAEFAKAAMNGFLSSLEFCNESDEDIARWSVEQADALIARLNQDT